MLTDTHTHLYSLELSEDLDAAMQRAADVGVTKFYMPNVDDKTIAAMLAVEEKYEGRCLAMMGLHPCSVANDYKEKLRITEHWLAQRPFVAVGEIGLDYYWSKAHIKEQQDVLLTQLQWAIDLRLPVVIHSRDSFDDILSLIEQAKLSGLRGVFHCFTGTAADAERAVGLGFMLGVGGVVTFKNGGLSEALENISLDNVVLETDAPYLAPVPHRGKRNESAYIKLVAEKVATIKQIDVEEVARITTANAQKLFHN